MKSRASIEGDIERLKNEIALCQSRAELNAIYQRADYKALGTAQKAALQSVINKRWGEVA